MVDNLSYQFNRLCRITSSALRYPPAGNTDHYIPLACIPALLAFYSIGVIPSSGYNRHRIYLIRTRKKYDRDQASLGRTRASLGLFHVHVFYQERYLGRAGPDLKELQELSCVLGITTFQAYSSFPAQLLPIESGEVNIAIHSIIGDILLRSRAWIQGIKLCGIEPDQNGGVHSYEVPLSHYQSDKITCLPTLLSAPAVA